MVKKMLTLLFIGLLLGCTSDADRYQPISNFDLQRYLGKWYEIARYDHRFETDLEQVSAEYSLRSDKGIKVINRGFDSKRHTWHEAEGKAYFVDQPNVGNLKVSFYGPFYGAYRIIELDKDYQYAIVTGGSKYFWILSRTPHLSKDLLETLLTHAKQQGFDPHQMIFPNQIESPR
jgi:apolipoprotein D and lipocalin family protein